MLRQTVKKLYESYVSRFQKRMIEKEFRETMGQIEYRRFCDTDTAMDFIDRGYGLILVAVDFNLATKTRPIDIDRMKRNLEHAEVLLDDIII